MSRLRDEGPEDDRTHDTEAEAWAAAAEFTRERQEEIRQLHQEIAMVERQLACQPDEIDVLSYSLNDVRNSQRNVARWSRILARLEAELTKLQQGMKL